MPYDDDEERRGEDLIERGDGRPGVMASFPPLSLFLFFPLPLSFCIYNSYKIYTFPFPCTSSEREGVNEPAQ